MAESEYHYEGQYDSKTRKYWLNGRWHEERALLAGLLCPEDQPPPPDKPEKL